MTGQTPVSVLSHGAVGDGFFDNTSAFQAAIDFAVANGITSVEVPPGVYRYWGRINLTGRQMFGYGDQTILYTGNEGFRAVRMTGSGAQLRDMRIVTHHSGRNGSNDAAAVLVDGATNFLVQNITIFRSAGPGIMVNASNNGDIVNCTVVATRADGIHITNAINTAASFSITVENCRVEFTGDDGIASVGYGSTGLNRNYDIHFLNNTVRGQGHGRAITMTGTRDSEVVGNYIEGGPSDNAGVLVMADSDPTFGTNSSFNISVSGNTLREAGRGDGGAGAIMVHQMYGTVNSLYDQYNITINNNQVYAARGDAIRVMGLNTRDITITNNTIYSPTDLSINLINNPTNVTQTNNQTLAASAYPGDQVAQVPGSSGTRPTSLRRIVTITCNGTATSGFAGLEIYADGIAAQTYFEIRANRSSNQTYVKTIKMNLWEDTRHLTFKAPGGAGRSVFLQSVQIDGIEKLSGEVQLALDTEWNLYIMPPARTGSELKALIPSGVPGVVTVQKIHYILDTLDEKTRQDYWRKGGGTYTALVTQSGVTFSLDGVSTFTVPSDAPVGWNCRVYQFTDVQVTFAAAGGVIRNVSGHTKAALRYSMVKLFVYANAGTAPQVILSGSTGV